MKLANLIVPYVWHTFLLIIVFNVLSIVRRAYTSSKKYYGGPSGWTRHDWKLSPEGRRSNFEDGYDGFIPLVHSRHMLSSINGSIEVCDNFYEHACGNWPTTHYESDLFDMLQNVVDGNIRRMLRDSPKYDFAGMMYRQCIDQGKNLFLKSITDHLICNWQV